MADPNRRGCDFVNCVANFGKEHLHAIDKIFSTIKKSELGLRHKRIANIQKSVR